MASVSTLLEQIGSESLMLGVWNRYRADARQSGRWTAEYKEFEHDAARRISQLAREVSRGKWRPGPVRQTRIPKPGGGYRRLGIPSLSDRIVERAFLLVLDPLVDATLTPWSFAYRRGLGPTEAVSSLVECRLDGADRVLRTDIIDCFDRIPRRILWNLMVGLVGDDPCADVIRSLIYRNDGLRRPQSRGVPQGSPLSPLFANVVLDIVDKKMAEKGFRCIRFSDDIAVPLWPGASSEGALQFLSAVLAELGLYLHETKTHTASFADGVDFLGQRVNDSTDFTRTHNPKRVSVYVTDQGALLRSKGQRLRVERSEKDDFSIAFDKVDHIVVFGRVGMTTPLLHQLLRRQIDLTLLSDTGGYFGRIEGVQATNPFMRVNQYRTATDPESALHLGRSVVAGKIRNQRTLLMRYSGRRGVGVIPSVKRLRRAEDDALRASNIDSLLGIEGAASRDYFGALATFLPDGWNFEGRKRRPPPDPVNSLLSFGYALLTQEVISALYAAGLDPYMGFLHRPRIGRPSLALDVVEEFRSPIVDSMVLRSLSIQLFAASDFVIEENPETNCRLSPDARRKFLHQYELRMLTLFAHPLLGRRVSWRQAIGVQSRHLADCLMGTAHQYVPVAWK